MLSYYIATDTKTSETFFALRGKVEIPPFEILETRTDALILGIAIIFKPEMSKK